MNQRWARLHQLIKEFQALLAPRVPPLQLHEGFGETFAVRSPTLNNPGVYLLFDKAEVLKYVGSATCEPMLDRIRTYLRPDNRLPVTPSHIDVIPFEWEWCFFAPALELYLIQKIECHRLMTSGDKLLNSVGMIAGLREWFNQTYGSGRNQDEADADYLLR